MLDSTCAMGKKREMMKKGPQVQREEGMLTTNALVKMALLRR